MPKRPPREWFYKMKKKIKKQYPSYSEKRINKIVAGIWYDYKASTRRRLLKKYEGGGTMVRKMRTNRRIGSRIKRKWGKIGAPKSAKRRRWLAKIRRKR